MKQQVNKFTPLELLVVIAIIGIFACTLLPSLQTARLRAREIACKSNQRQCGLAMQLHLNENRGILPLRSGVFAKGYLLDGSLINL